MRIYHVGAPTPKHHENSLRGIRYAARHGYDAIDLDLLMTRDGVVVGCHWDRPMRRDGFRDPLHKLDPDKRVRVWSWVQVSRLRAGRWPRRYRIQRVERLLAACAKHGIIAYLEPKDDARFENVAVWEDIRRAADAVGAHLRVRSIEDFGGYEAGLRRVQAARSAGIAARTI